MTVVPDPNVLFVNVSADTNDTKVEFAPNGNNIVLVAFAECGCDFMVCPCEFAVQFNFIAPSLVFPKTSMTPVPFESNIIFPFVFVACMLFASMVKLSIVNTPVNVGLAIGDFKFN